MATLNATTGAVRRKLQFPDEDKLSDGIIWEYTVEFLDELITELNRTDQSWNVPRFTLDVAIDEDYIPIDARAPDFSLAHFVQTANESDLKFHGHPVPIVDEAALLRNYDGGDPGPTGVKHSARAFAFIYKDGQHLIRIGPRPGAACQYIVTYEPDVVRPGDEQEPAFRFRQFDNYVSDMVAFTSLPHAAWRGLDPQMTAGRKDEIGKTLLVSIERRSALFRRFKMSDRQTDSFRMIPWGYRRWGRGGR